MNSFDESNQLNDAPFANIATETGRLMLAKTVHETAGILTRPFSQEHHVVERTTLNPYGDEPPTTRQEEAPAMYPVAKEIALYP